MSLLKAIEKQKAAGDFDPWLDVAEEWTTAAFALVKAETGLTLPPEAVEFLSTYGGLGAETENAFFVDWPDQGKIIHEFRSIGDDPDTIISNDRVFRKGDKALKDPVLFIGELDGGQKFLLISCDGEETGAIFIWSGLAGPADPDQLHPPLKIANSIGDFLLQLAPFQEL